MSQNIQQFTPFEGPDQIIIGNGQGLPINSSGVTAFSSPLKPHISLTLNNLLYVPNITKNLISVNQFCKDNYVFFEFHSTFCLVKSQDTKDTLLMGVVGPDGLYQFPSLLRPRQQSAITPSAYIASCNSVSYATIQHRLICPHTHHQNGVVERKHRHIVELGLTMLAQAHLPMHFWDHAFLTIIYLINRLPSSSIQHDVPFIKLFH
uniref:Retrovirus-related Pol polyprotein from transposon TNT 1-94 n=1 Tax=Cajanus cajan TaxID=3821 RepID=A0A151RZ55_CAJCA|nr:Retrovirus-related Pol polyprotein from transposon TNT 1-94 [Cajanus cajan]